MDSYWGPATKVMADTNFLNNLMDYDKDHMEGILGKLDHLPVDPVAAGVADPVLDAALFADQLDLASPVPVVIGPRLGVLLDRTSATTADLMPRHPIEYDGFSNSTMLPKPEFFESIHRGDLHAHRASISGYARDGVILSTGEHVDCDTVILATGWRTDYGFLPEPVRKRIEFEGDGYYLYRQMIHPGVPRLAFIGSNAATYINILTHNLQARWLTEVIKGNVTLPSNSEIEAIVEREKAWRRDHLKHAGSARAYLIQLHQTRYWDSLLIDMGANVKRKHSCLGPVVSALQQFFAPVVSKDYKTIVTGEWKSNPREVRALGITAGDQHHGALPHGVAEEAREGLAAQRQLEREVSARHRAERAAQRQASEE